MRKPSRPWLMGGLSLLILIGFLCFFRTGNLSSYSIRAESVTATVLKAHGASPDRDLLAESAEQRKSGRLQWRLLEQRFRVPAAFSWGSFRGALEAALQRNHLTLLKSQREPKRNLWVSQMDIARGSVLVYRVVLEQPRAGISFSAAAVPTFPKGSGKIALVLDDWGYSLHQVPALTSIRQHVTVSILPSLPYSTDVAKAAQGCGHEVILHMPMEAKDPRAPREIGTILTTMSSQDVLRHLDQSLATVPFAKGISNHQGSKATSDQTLMETVLREIKRRNLYFLDSLTSHSVCKEVAHRRGLRYARRGVFIDNDESPARIQQQLLELTRLAQKNGVVVGIGHDRPNTLQVLQGALPALEKAGYQLVVVSEIAEVP